MSKKQKPDWDRIHELEHQLDMKSEHLGAPPPKPQPKGADTTRHDEKH